MGPYFGHPPEGMYLIDVGAAAGQMSGTPRRYGNFTVYYHIYSQLVPNERGQHGFATFNFDIEESELPVPGPQGPFTQDGSFTDEGVLILNAPYSTLPEFESGVNYNPDALSHSPAGLQLLAQAGVPFDNNTDGAHSSQVSFGNPQEPIGGYKWVIDQWNPVSMAPAPVGIDLQPGPAGAPYSTGVLETTNPAALVRSSRRLVDLRVIDDQLPIANEVPQRYGYSIGPDKWIITQSTTSSTKTTITGTADFDMMDASKVVRRFEVKGGLGTFADLDSTDLTNTTTIPSLAVDGLDVTSNTALGELLSGLGDPNLDLVRIAVNPTTYRDDAHAVNPHAARAGQSADHNRGRSWQAPTYQSSPGWQTNVGAVHLPDATGVSHNPTTGVFTDGGRLHAFDSAGHFGFFIIRSDASIYVPFATDKSTYETFGDSMLTARANKANSNLISCQITYSPDGRWAACEITTSTAGTSQYLNSATTSRIVLFSLCGETPAAWGGETYQIVEPLPAGGLTGGNYMFAMSMALTNNHLYYLIGNEVGTYGHWRDHWVCRYDIDSGGPNGELVPGITGQNSTTPVQTPFQGDGSGPVQNFSTFTSGPPSGFITVTTTQNELYLYDGWNALETSHAPMPFRVSANGMACAILAGPNNSSSTSGTEVMRHHLFVAYDTQDARQASTASQYHYVPMGGTRGPTLLRGPSSYRQWGWQSGPATAFEISDDGMRAAFTGFAGSRSVSGTSSNNWSANNQEVFAFSATGSASDPWSTVSVPPSSTNGNVSGNIFQGSHNWRFGSLGFTADNNSLFFWAGSPNVNMTSTSSTYIEPHHMEGTYYIIDLSNTTTKQVKSMLARTDGGSGDGIRTYTTASPVNITSTSNYSGALGYVMPIGGFYSKNRNFFYCVDFTPHNSQGAPQALLGFNVSAYTSNTINGKTAGEGFEVDNYPNRRPFVTQYYYMPHYALDFRYYAPGLSQGMSREVVAKDTGWVFWAPQYARSGPSNSTSINSFSSGPSIRTYWSAYDNGAEVWGFEPNVAGPATELTHPGLGADSGRRMIHSLEVTDAGDLLSYVWDDNSGGTVGYDDERIGHIYGISFDPVTGVIDPNYDNATNSVTIENSDGRAGEAMAHDSTGRRLFYAYRQGTGGNENDKGLVMATRNADGSITVSRYATSAIDSERYDVLFAGR
ncbi:MAG: hypothetical protein QNJ98_15530, partial [Planctomycetota bacterium]|nr:hypothetical protein [Planctomycetota bacterium]